MLRRGFLPYSDRKGTRSLPRPKNASKALRMKFALGVVLAALAVFTWEALSWTVLGWHESAWRQFRDEGAMEQIFAPSMTNANTQVSSGAGIYVMPAEPRHSKHATPEEIRNAEADYAKARENGPWVYAIVRPGRRVVSMSSNLLISFIRTLVCATLIAAMLSQAMLSYPGRICFVAAAGLFAGLVSDLPMWIWFENPGRDTIVNVADHFFAWIIGGVLMGLFVGKDVVITKGV